MKLLAVGGGSGGHVTPVLAVINELYKLDRDLHVRFVCDIAFEAQSRGLMKQATTPVVISTIPAGKFRRYHGESTIDKLKDVRTIALNLRDLVFIAGGFFKSLFILVTDRPDVVFAKGGFVSLPMGLAASILRIPLVIHDSDTRPGLTNSILGRFATKIGTGSPLENYTYDPAKASYVGVPVGTDYQPFNQEQITAARHTIGMVDITAPLVVVFGGGLGSRIINDAIARSGQDLIDAGVHIYHIAGKKNYDDLISKAPSHPHYMIVPFVYKGLHSILGAADIVVTRAGANSIQELAALSKAAIIVPASHLGDQVKNAKMYEEAKAALVLSDQAISESDVLGTTIISLVKSPVVREKLEKSLHTFAKPQAAKDVAHMIQSASVSFKGPSRGV